MTAYPPPATGTNYNMISAVGYGEGEHVFWMVMHSPEGRFVYDYKIRKSLNNKTPAKRLKSEAAFEALMKQRIAENAHGIVEATKPYQDSGAPTKCAREVPAL